MHWMEASKLDYKGLMELAKRKAANKADLLYPFWLHRERREAQERLTIEYYRQYTMPNGAVEAQR